MKRSLRQILPIALLFAAAHRASSPAQSSDEFEAMQRQVGELYNVGKQTDAVALAEQALKHLEMSKVTEDDRALRRALTLVGGLYAARGRLAEAEHMFRRSLAIAQKELGPDHPDVADLLNNLGALHDIQGHYQRAEALYRQALAIRLRVLSPDHSDLAVSHANLARLHRQQANPSGPER